MKNSKSIFFTISLCVLLSIEIVQYAHSKTFITIYIRSDGSVDPPTVPIKQFGNLYLLQGNINGAIVVERDDIVVDGGGHTLSGDGAGIGIDLKGRVNVTIKNMKITGFSCAVNLLQGWALGGSNNTFYGNYIVNNTMGFCILGGSNNIITYNTIANNTGEGLCLFFNASRNIVTKNNFINNFSDVILWLQGEENLIYENYWDKYNGTDSDGDGIGDKPHIFMRTDYLVAQDPRPLMNPVGIIEPPKEESNEEKTDEEGPIPPPSELLPTWIPIITVAIVIGIVTAVFLILSRRTKRLK